MKLELNFENKETALIFMKNYQKVADELQDKGITSIMDDEFKKVFIDYVTGKVS